MRLCSLSLWVTGCSLPSGGSFSVGSLEETWGMALVRLLGTLWFSEQQGAEVSSRWLLADHGERLGRLGGT